MRHVRERKYTDGWVYSCKYEREGALMGVLMGCILTGGRGRVLKR